MEKHMLLRYAFHFLCISGFKRRLKNLELFKGHCVLQVLPAGLFQMVTRLPVSWSIATGQDATLVGEDGVE